MEHGRAKEIIRRLADGRDPATGDLFPPNSPYQQADTVRALYVALGGLSSAPSTSRRVRTPRPTDPSKPKVEAAWCHALGSPIRVTQTQPPAGKKQPAK